MMTFDRAWAQFVYNLERFISFQNVLISLLAIILGCVVAHLLMNLCRRKEGKAVFAIVGLAIVSGLLVFDGWKDTARDAMNSVREYFPQSWSRN
jgi:hypothetical protein